MATPKQEQLDEPGLHLLYPTEDPSHCTVDVVAVHGFGGGAFSTWMHSSGSMWLRDVLPQELEMTETRIMTYGYDSLFFVNPSQSVNHFEIVVKDLLQCLWIKRAGDQESIPFMERSRPIIFIGHSLGGVVVKGVLAHCRVDRRYEDILKSTKSILFFATPNDLSNRKTGEEFISKLIRAVGVGIRGHGQHYAFLDYVALTEETFNHLATGLEKIVMFREALPVKFVGYILSPGSTFLQHPNEIIVDLRADHVQICKFKDVTDENYMLVHAQLYPQIKKLQDSLPVQHPLVSATKRALDDVESPDEVMRDADDFSSDSNISPPMYTLTEIYGDLEESLQKMADFSLSPELEGDYEDVKNSLEDCYSSLVCWGCDIRIETDSLKHVEGTIYDLTIRSCFGRIADLLQPLGVPENFANPTHLGDLKTAISSLRDFVGPIRTSQALNTGQGPLDGMVKKLNELQKITTQRDDGLYQPIVIPLYVEYSSPEEVNIGGMKSRDADDNGSLMYHSGNEPPYTVLVERLLAIDGWEDGSKPLADRQPMTLIVLQYSVRCVHEDGRFASIRLWIDLEDNKMTTREHKAAPKVEAWAPFVPKRLSKEREQDVHTQKRSKVEVGVGGAGISAKIGVNAAESGDRKEVFFDRGLTTKRFSGLDSGRPNGVEWFLTHNSLNQGIPPEFRIAMLLKRETDAPFEMTLGLRCSVRPVNNIKDQLQHWLGTGKHGNKTYAYTPNSIPRTLDREGEQLLKMVDSDNMRELMRSGSEELQGLTTVWGLEPIKAPDEQIVD